MFVFISIRQPTCMLAVYMCTQELPDTCSAFAIYSIQCIFTYVYTGVQEAPEGCKGQSGGDVQKVQSWRVA